MVKHSLGYAAAVAVVIVGSAACGPSVRASRIGAPQPSRGSECELQFEDLSPVAATEKYEPVGSLAVTGSSDFRSEETRRLLQPHACEMGGEIVTAGAGMPDRAMYLVFRSKR